MDTAAETDDQQVRCLVQMLLSHARAKPQQDDLNEMAWIAACACALNNVHGLKYDDTGRFAFNSRFFATAGGQFWDRNRAYVLCIDDEVMDAFGNVGWSDVLDAHKKLRNEEVDWTSDALDRTAGVLVCQDLGSRCHAMLALAKELEAIAGAWIMQQDTGVAESGPKPRRM